MTIVVNGEPKPLDDGATVGDVVTGLGHDRAGRGIAAALNGEVVPRDRWFETSLEEGDKVEVLTAVGGG